jgi:hypothetical protein
MANPDDTTIPGEDFMDTLAPAPPLPAAADPRLNSDAPDRLLFFFSGFDPKGATFYHRLFRNGIGQRNAAHDETLALGKRHRIGRWASVWTSLWRGAPQGQAGRPTTMRTRVHFMRWEDLIKRHWRRETGQLLRDYWNVYAGGLRTGVLARVWRQAPQAFWMAVFPLVVALGAVVGGTAIVGGLLALTELLPVAAALLVGLVTGLVLWRLLAAWVDCEWLLRLYAFMRQHARGELPLFDARMDEMATRMVEAVEARMRQPGASPLREVMLVGYSSGTVLAASVMARALPRLKDLLDSRRTQKGATLSLLTLGHCLPIVTEWPEARQARAELDLLSESSFLTWHDYSSAKDRAAFWKEPPWPRPALLKGYQTSPPFKATANALQFAALRRERREMHLQYLRPPGGRRDDAGLYDFFELVCGPVTLAERHCMDKPLTDMRKG